MTADSAPANDANASGALQILVPVQPSKTTDSYARTLPTLAPVHVKSLTLAGMGKAMPTRVLGPAAGDNRIKMIATEQAKNTQRCNALVVGAGLGGMAAAIGIRKAGHNMIVLERMPELREIGAGTLVPPNSSKILKKWGILEVVPRAAQPHDIAIHSYKDGRVLSKQILDPAIQAGYLKALDKEAKELGVTIQSGSVVKSIDFGKASIFLEDGKTREAELIIGADSERSFCQDALLRYPDPHHPSGDVLLI